MSLAGLVLGSFFTLPCPLGILVSFSAPVCVYVCMCVCVCVCVFLLRLYPLSRLLVLVTFLEQFSTYISLRASYLSVEYFEKGLMWPSSLSYDHTHQALSWFSLTWGVDLPWLGAQEDAA